MWMAYWGSEPSLQLFRRRRLLNILLESVIETMLFHFSLFTRLTVLEMREGREAYHAKHNAQYTALFYFPFWSAHVSKRHNYTSANAISRIVHIYFAWKALRPRNAIFVYDRTLFRFQNGKRYSFPANLYKDFRRNISGVGRQIRFQ